MRIWVATAMVLGALGAFMPSAAAPAPPGKPVTIVLVHGAFAGSSSWNGVISALAAEGYPVIAAANPLRSVKGDGAYVASLIASIPGPVVLVGHSYGGEVISAAAVGRPNVKALVFVAGLAPEAGESAVSLGQRFPTGTLGETLAKPVPLPGGGQDLYIQTARYRGQFAPDVPEGEVVQMAATQRPVTEAALAEPAGAPAWRSVPSWFVWGSADKNIPSALHAFMADRAKAREAVEIKDASHVVMISHPRDVAAVIEHAAEAAEAPR